MTIYKTGAKRADDNWIQTFTGRQFWPLDPVADDIDIRDIAHALSMKCRFSGHCQAFYSVAQHSRLVSFLCPDKDALWGLLHDAAEAYLPDVARPIKRELVGFREIEERIMRCVAERFDLSWPMPESIHDADLRALATERRDVMGKPPSPWKAIEGIECSPLIVWPYAPKEAHENFLARFAHLTRKEGADSGIRR